MTAKSKHGRNGEAIFGSRFWVPILFLHNLFQVKTDFMSIELC